MKKSLDIKNIFGLFLILWGGGMILDRMNLVEMDVVWDYFWPILLVFFGIMILSKSYKNKGGLIFVILGIIAFLSVLFSFSFWVVLFPTILIVIGLQMVFKNIWSFSNIRKNIGLDSFDEVVIFNGWERKFKSQRFKGGKLVTIFGGAEIDLRDIKPTENAEIEITAIFGGAEIKTGSNYVVQTEGTVILGAFEDKRTMEPEEDAPKLRITGEAIFGGVEIKE